MRVGPHVGKIIDVDAGSAPEVTTARGEAGEHADTDTLTSCICRQGEL